MGFELDLMQDRQECQERQRFCILATHGLMLWLIFRKFDHFSFSSEAIDMDRTRQTYSRRIYTL